MKTRLIALGGAAWLAAGAVSAAAPGLPSDQQPPHPLRNHKLTGGEGRFFDLCAPLRQSGPQSFPEVFPRAVAMYHRPAQMFNMLICWAQCGGRPTVGNRQDLGMHFLFAGALEANFDRGDQVSVVKELTDGLHDFNDLAAGLAGSEWVRRASRDREWAAQWATGRKTLAKNLPAFQYGTGRATNGILTIISQDIDAAYAR